MEQNSRTRAKLDRYATRGSSPRVACPSSLSFSFANIGDYFQSNTQTVVMQLIYTWLNVTWAKLISSQCVQRSSVENL